MPHVKLGISSAAIAGLLALALAWIPSQRRVLYEGDSPYTHLLVTEEEPGVRALRFERKGARQSVIRVGAPLELQLPYARASMTALGIVPDPRRVLIVGLGGGSMAMFLQALFPEAEIDAVDIDPGVVEVAVEYFGLRPGPRLRAVVADGRKFLEESPGGYDLVFLDAFGGDWVPPHLVTAEFMRALRAKLSARGLAIANVWRPKSNPTYFDVLATYREVFGEVCVLDVPGAVNQVVLSRADGTNPVPDPEALARRVAEVRTVKRIPFELEGYARAGCVPQRADLGRVLRD